VHISLSRRKDRLAQIVVQPLDHAEVEHSHDALGQEHEVPGMWIRVIKAITEDHLQLHVRAAPRELAHLRVRSGEYLDLRHEHASSRSMVSTRREHRLRRRRLRRSKRSRTEVRFMTVAGLMRKGRFGESAAGKPSISRPRVNIGAIK
jgi:hypothetical protein